MKYFKRVSKLYTRGEHTFETKRKIQNKQANNNNNKEKNNNNNNNNKTKQKTKKPSPLKNCHLCMLQLLNKQSNTSFCFLQEEAHSF